MVNRAETVAGAVSDTWQAPAPAHAPLQPANAEPASGVAVSVIGVPPAKLAEQVAPQLIPAGALVTVPEPAPVLATVSVGGEPRR